MITGVAIKKDSVVYQKNKPYRHDAIFKDQEIGFFDSNSIQGFVTDSLEFLDRKEAAEYAFKNGQVKEKFNILMSEDLW